MLKRCRFFLLPAAGVALSMTGAAHAQPDDFGLVPLQSGNLLSLWGSAPYEPGEFGVALGFQARSLAASSTASSGPIDGTRDGAARQASESSFELLGSVGLWQDWDASAALGLERLDFGASELDGSSISRSALGNLRLCPRWRLLRFGSRPDGLALLLPLWIPLGQSSLYGADQLRVEPRVAASVALGPLAFIANAGYQLHAAEPSAGIHSTNFLSPGVGVELQLASDWQLLSELSSHWLPHSGAASGEARLAVRYASAGWGAQLGAGKGAFGAERAPDWRLLAALSFGPLADEPALAPVPAAPAPAAPDAAPDYPQTNSDWQAPQ